ncbi:Two-component sensor histidine kinase, contains HisKA and HATPase domains [Pedobacter westerhofensis]|uniref:histidine kinase n=1 Tax=Pedobacter westerhofensis TaxID=425512 RepID=A0A521BNY6_9SPHI|nr:sensor histidine kinase [Pedobacter westerhofensis]SMO48877.1 Two-component sensor histidine kinase, contains HisKA and HATPase domains [Pedobacter westerhofensis]
MTRSLFIFSLLLFSIAASAQNTQGDLAVQREAENDPAPFASQLQSSVRDTNKVNLLCKIARICWYQRTVENHAVDSTLLFARRAYALSRDINFTEGHNEAVFLICKVLLERAHIDQALKLADEVYGEEKVRLLLIIAEPYVFHQPPSDKEFAKAMPLIEKAVKLSAQAHSLRWTNECLNLLAKLYFNKGDVVLGKHYFMDIINNYHHLKDYNNEAKYWSRLAEYMPENNKTYTEMIHSYERAVYYYLLAGNKKEAGYSLRDLALIRTNFNQTAQAGQDQMKMLSLFKEIHEQLSPTTYFQLSEYYQITGKYDLALSYALGGLKAAGDNLDKRINPARALGTTYGFLKDYKNAVKYSKIAFDYDAERNSPNMFLSCYRVVTFLTAGGNAGQALLFLNKFLAAHSLSSISYQQIYASCYGTIYNALGNYAEADRYYRQMMSLEEAANRENGERIGHHFTMTGGYAYYLMGKFYVERGRYKQSRSYLIKSLDNPHYGDKDQEFDTYKLLFKVDSALANYVSAIRYFERHKAMADSINNVETANKISALNIQYETAEKTKDIRLLENKQKLQLAAVQKADTIRNFTIGASVLLLLLASSAYLGYRDKQRSNRQLQLQQNEINVQNAALQTLLMQKDDFLNEKDELLDEKDGLLKEKDWLLKEVHHRVKNNLQIIMSLLRTQLAHLKNEDAKDAIMDSENRVQAIALIHQKLYSTENVASVSMPAYVADLVNHLTDGLQTPDKKVKVQQSVEPIHLDLAQAVPIGLILNEAITNSLKYGANESGVDITITFRCMEGANALLIIADKGRGLPSDFDLATSKSLGMQLMKGLSKQLKGCFNISSGPGVTVTIEFKLLSLLSAVKMTS